MANSIRGRKVAMFRCQIPPQLTQKIQQAHVGMDAVVDDTCTGVFVKVPNDKGFDEHFVPFTNIQSIRLHPEDYQEEKFLEKKGPGRPAKSQAV